MGIVEGTESVRHVIRASALIALLFVVGTLGYLEVGPPGTTLLDAAYMTVITLTTVGYGEVVDLSGNVEGRIFTISLLLSGVGAFLYFFSTATAFAVEGTLFKLFRRRRMRRKIKILSDHYIVCGGGHTGEHIVAELHATQRPFVLIEPEIERGEALQEMIGTFPWIAGDATADDTLAEAGIERARGIVAAVRDDKDNLIITISARILNPTARIIARCVDAQVQRKLRRAGADAVVSPNQIGGLRMVSELVRPTTVNFLDQMLRENDTDFRVEEAVITAASPMCGKPLRDAMAEITPRTVVVALRLPDNSWRYNPGAQDVLHEGTALVFIGTPKARAALAEVATAS